jgi:hypothetical protein
MIMILLYYTNNPPREEQPCMEVQTSVAIRSIYADLFEDTAIVENAAAYHVSYQRLFLFCWGVVLCCELYWQGRTGFHMCGIL